MAFVTEKPGNDIHKWRVVDFDRDIVLKSSGTIGMRSGRAFELKIRDQAINFTASVEKKFHDDGTISELSWKIDQMPIPTNLSAENLKNIISDALREYGYLYDNKAIKRISIQFPQTFINR